MQSNIENFGNTPIFDFQNVCKPKLRLNINIEPNGSQRVKKKEKKGNVKHLTTMFMINLYMS